MANLFTPQAKDFWLFLNPSFNIFAIRQNCMQLCPTVQLAKILPGYGVMCPILSLWLMLSCLIRLHNFSPQISPWQGLHASDPVGALQHHQFRSVLTHPLWDRSLPSHDREDSNPQRPHQRRICHFILPGELTHKTLLLEFSFISEEIW